MSAIASLALIQTIVGELAADDPLTTLLGGERIYDAAPRNARFPYVLIGQDRARDWSTGTESGTEHLLVLDVFSRARGRREASQIANRIAVLLDDQPMPLDGHDLINLRVEDVVTERLTDARTFRATLSLRAVTEPAA